MRKLHYLRRTAPRSEMQPLFDELDRYLAERKIKKKDFLIDCIREKLDAAKAEHPAE